MHSPLFSIVIPAYNREDILPRAIRSVLNQNFEDFELIIVDDGSTDDTGQVVKEFADARVRYFHQQNKGVSAARNFGIDMSSGKYVAFLDSDDEALPDWLEQFAGAFNSQDAGVVCVGAKIIDAQKKGEEIWLPQNRGPVYENQTGLFLSGSFALRREIFGAIGGYVDGLAYSENSELALRLTAFCRKEKIKIASIAKALVVYYRDMQQWARDEGKFKLRLHSAEYILRHHGARYRKRHPRGFTNYCAIAGVNAIRLGCYRKAMHYFLLAIRIDPWNWRHYGRLFLAITPFLGRRLWLRFN